MNLKKLHECALWHKLSDPDFRKRVIDTILSQTEEIDKLNSTIVELTDTIAEHKKLINNLNVKTTRLNKQSRYRASNNDNHIEQKRDS